MYSPQVLKIGIIGGIRAGKDTVAYTLSKELKEFTQLFAFADGIHQVIKLTMPHVYANGKPRKELQHIGQALREVHEDVWVDMLFNSNRYHFADNTNANIIVTDVRQPNEAERLQAEGFTLIKVVASKEVRVLRALNTGDNFSHDSFAHGTEKSVDTLPYDYLINNNGTLDELTMQVRSLINAMQGGAVDEL